MLDTRLSEILTLDLIHLGLTAPTLTQAIRETLPAAMRRANVTLAQQETILDAIDERERTASTIAPPLALPHVRHDATPRILAALAVNRDGIVGDNVRILVPFVSPATAAAEHLRFLSGVVKLFRSRDVLDEILDAQSAEDVLTVLRSRNA